MIEVEDAIKIILETTPRRKSHPRVITDINHHTIAQKILSQRDQPPFDRVAMDGIALNSKSSLLERKIEGVQAAGDPALSLKDPNNCIEAMTGAPLPIGCDSVIPYENIEIKDGVAKIKSDDLTSYNNIHRRGVDYLAQTEILDKDRAIHSPLVAIIASQGSSNVECYALPKICIISSGNELVQLDRPIEEHQIYTSNSYAIEHELKNFGITEISKIHIPDNSETTERIIEDELEKNDILILTGGVSKGKFDYIPTALEKAGLEKKFHKIKQKPGKPMWYGVKNEKQVFALPGNPVSCLTCLRRYVIPSINYSIHKEEKAIYGQLTKAIHFKKEFTLFAPVSANYTKNGILELTPLEHNGSGDFYSLGNSDGFIELPAKRSEFTKGEAYQYFPWKI